jgi:hypothetical protein
MIVLGILLGVILVILMIIGICGSVKDKNRKKTCKNWKVGDKLSLIRGDYHRILEQNSKEFATLEGWDLNNLYISCGNNMTYKVNWSVMTFNKSATWRQNYDDAKKVMGCEPGFTGGVGESSKSTGKKVDGKPVDLMNEIECEVYLKRAIENEDFNAAELIKKRMEKFR